MNSFKKSILGVTGFLALAFLLVFGCADTPEDPAPNVEPDTFISSYNIDITPDSASFYYATVYWRGSDFDGETQEYIYWVDSDAPDTTLESSVRFRAEFSEATPTHTFSVKSRDNMNTWDQTPATVVLSMDDVRHGDQFNPQTVAVSVPANGSETSQAVNFAISASDLDGFITEFEYAIDDPTAWTSVPPDFTTGNGGTVEILLSPADSTELAVGTHTLYFRGVDNMGHVDESPVSVSINCLDTFAPELSVSISDGQSYIVPFTDPTLVDFTVGFSATVDFYYGIVDSFVVITSFGDTLSTTETSLILGDLSAGAYWIDVTVYDAAGASTPSGPVNFIIVELPAGDGVLCVNGVDWGTYGSQIIDLWDGGSPWGNRTNYKCWDLFDTTPVGSVPDMADSLLGYGSIPSWMFDTTFFDAITWIGNNYSGDLAYWEDSEADIMAYLEMGGNIILPVRFGDLFFFDDLAAYTGIVADSWVAPGADILTAQDVRLTDLNVVQGQANWLMPDTDNPDNVWIYEASTVAPGKHAGFITLPNGEAGGGGFCYIAGRSYRWNQTDLKANIDVILNTFFGIN